MGGCRCIFRDCSVSKQSCPKMHFFYLPVRDPKLLSTWLRNCSNERILNVEPNKLGYRTVCARHFRSECFMNYKMDRLMPPHTMPTPTLVRIDKETAWDLEDLDENGYARLVKLPPPTGHLKPPQDFECPLGFDEKPSGHSFSKYLAQKLTPPRPLAAEPKELTIKRRKVEKQSGEVITFVLQKQEQKTSRHGLSKPEQMPNQSEKAIPKVVELKPRTNGKQIEESVFKIIEVPQQEAEPNLENFPQDPELSVEVTAVIESIMQTPSLPTQEAYDELQQKYSQLKDNFDQLSKDYNQLQTNYSTLLNKLKDIQQSFCT